MLTPTFAGVLTSVAVAALLFAEWRGWRAGVWIAKPLASLGFVLAALAWGAAGTQYGRLMLIAFVLSFAGDVLLIPKRTFVAGLASFLLAHVAFSVAFASRGAQAPFIGVWLGVLGATGWFVLRWLEPHLPSKLRIPVIAYITAIVIMASIGLGMTGSRLVPLGAVMFFLSDISVARDKFVAKGFVNKLWGLPLYYGAQLVLAASCGAAVPPT